MIGIHFNAASRRDRGTWKVADNLLKGLDRLGIEYRVNPPDPCKWHGVLQGHGRLWAERSNRSHILWGPNLVVLPSEAPWCFGPSYRHVVPCEWVKRQYQLDASCKALITVWPVGIDTDVYSDDGKSKIKKDCLIYWKNATKQRSQVDISDAIEHLLRRGQTYSVVKYGEYIDEDFQQMCKEHRYMLVIAGTESQFIALLEAFSIGIPAYVLDMQTMLYKGVEYTGQGYTTAPYFDHRCGIVCGTYGRLTEFIERLREFTPREYILENFTLEKMAEKYYNALTCQVQQPQEGK